jgi:hypothetical protein
MPAFDAILSWVQVVGYLLLFLTVAPLFPFLYVVLKWRTQGGAGGEGTRGALLYFVTVSVLLAISGASNLIYGYFSTTPVDEAMTRISYGLLFGSILFGAVSAFQLWRAGTSADARRVFAGFFAVMAGLVSLTAVVLFFIALCRKAEADPEIRADEMKLYGAWAACFLLSYLGTIVRLSSRR